MITQYVRGKIENRNAKNRTNIYIQINSHSKLYHNKCVLTYNYIISYFLQQYNIHNSKLVIFELGLYS